MDTQLVSSGRLVIIGWDGGTWSLLQPLAEQGVMPNLAGLIARSSYGNLNSSIPPLTSPAWISFLTGKNPGKHGCLLFTQINSEPDASPQIINSSHVDSQTLWEVIGAAGKRVISVNVPMTYPPRPINGLVITGMMTPSKDTTFTYPPDLLESYEFLQDYIIDLGVFSEQEGMGIDRLVTASPYEYLNQVQTMSERRLNGCLELMTKELWQAFMVVFTGVDRISHFFWKELSALAAGVPVAKVPFGEKLVDYYRWLDTGLASLIACAGEETHILIMSDHGFGPAATRVLYLNSWLYQADYLSLQESATKKTSQKYWLMHLKSNPFGSKLLRALAMSLPNRWRNAARRHSIQQQSNVIDWEQTLAYTVPMASYVAGIMVRNMESDAQRESIVAQLIQALAELVDPDSGKPIFRWVARREEVYTGRHVAEFPDIIVVADENYNIVSSVLGRGYVAPQLLSIRSGDHRDDGIILINGKNVMSKRLEREWNLTDAAATILYLLGVPLPDDLDGQPILEAFTPEALAQFQVTYQEAHPPTAQNAPVELSSDEKEVLFNSLRSLGYIE